MRTVIGKATVTINQVHRAKSVYDDNVFSIVFMESGDIIVESKEELTEEQKTNLIERINQIPDEEPETIKEHKNKLRRIETNLRDIGMSEETINHLMK